MIEATRSKYQLPGNSSIARTMPSTVLQSRNCSKKHRWYLLRWGSSDFAVLKPILIWCVIECILRQTRAPWFRHVSNVCCWPNAWSRAGHMEILVYPLVAPVRSRWTEPYPRVGSAVSPGNIACIQLTYSISVIEKSLRLAAILSENFHPTALKWSSSRLAILRTCSRCDSLHSVCSWLYNLFCTI